MHDVWNNTSPPQISNLFDYQHNIHSYNTRSSARGNFFLQYSRLDKQNMSFSRNGVRNWNNLSNEIRQMPKVKFKRNIHNMLLQKLSVANEYIDLLDFNMPWKLNSTHFLHCPSLALSFSSFCLIFLWIFLFSKCYTGQYCMTIINFT